MFILDTNVISELRQTGGKKPNPAVERWVRDQQPETLFLSSIVVFELVIGVVRMERRDPRQGAALRRWLAGSVLTAFAGQILDVDEKVASFAASLHVPNPRPVNDSLIAATAIVHGMTIATRNTGDFQGLPVGLINPWEV